MLCAMLAAIHSAAILGIEAYDVTVEVDAARGLPAWTIVGLPAGAVKESRERVGAALVNSGFTLPPRRVTVNLAPAGWTTAKRPALRKARHRAAVNQSELWQVMPLPCLG